MDFQKGIVVLDFQKGIVLELTERLGLYLPVLICPSMILPGAYFMKVFWGNKCNFTQ